MELKAGQICGVSLSLGKALMPKDTLDVTSTPDGLELHSYVSALKHPERWRRVDDETFETFARALVDDVEVGTWKRRYTAESVFAMLEGDQWSLTLTDRAGKTLLRSRGANALPSERSFWELLKAARMLEPGFARNMEGLS